jgi:hypothetical protein
MSSWLVVANSARARILEVTDAPGFFIHRADLVHTTGPEGARFAQEIAAIVNGGVSRGECDGLTLLATDPFLGQLRSRLSVHACRALQDTAPSSARPLTDKDIARRLNGPWG